jgi:hypothetical protein
MSKDMCWWIELAVAGAKPPAPIEALGHRPHLFGKRLFHPPLVLEAVQTPREGQNA